MIRPWRFNLLCMLVVTAAPWSARAQAPAEARPPVKLGEVPVTEQAEKTTRFLAPVEGQKLLEGKKVTSTVLQEDLPAVTQSNPRQLLSRTPGLLVSEVSNGSWSSFSYRGLGEPHESWNLLLLKDGLPVSPDQFSYPAAYYTPPSESVERIDFYRGGASLLFGPQPGGALDYVTRPPSLKPVAGRAKLTSGSFGQLTAYAAVSGTAGRIGYLVDFNHFRFFEGPRSANSDGQTFSGNLLLTIDAQKATRYFLRFDGFGGDFGEPGGLTVERFKQDVRAVSTPFDRFRPQRYVGSLVVQHDFSARTSLEATAFGGAYDRTSRRQASSRFGELANPANVSLVQSQQFALGGVQARLRHDYTLGEQTQTLTAGLAGFLTSAPVSVRKGDSPTDDVGRAGELTRADRATRALSLFAENAFRLGKWSIVPGLRFDLLSQAVAEAVDLLPGSAQGGPPGAPNGELGARQSLAPVLLPGLGVKFQALEELELYANVSRSYKPLLFNDGVTFQAGINVAPVFAPTFAWSGELGARGQVGQHLVYDASLFYVNLENTVGLLGNDTGGATRTNVGRMINFGGDASAEFDVLGFARRGSDEPSAYGKLVLFANAQLLSARFFSGPLEGLRPQYAPPYLVRAGVSYRWRELAKVMLLSTLLGPHSGVDNAKPLFDIPAYQVVDLTAELRFAGGRLSFLGGINNLFDARYFARIRPGGGGGVDPGLPRNLYLGLSSEL